MVVIRNSLFVSALVGIALLGMTGNGLAHQPAAAPKNVAETPASSPAKKATVKKGPAKKHTAPATQGSDAKPTTHKDAPAKDGSKK